MTTIYIVTSGEYSDYGIVGVYDSQEKAQALIDYEHRRQDARGDAYSNEYEIEEWELNQHYDPISRGLTCYTVDFADATVGDGTAEVHSAADYEGNGLYYVYRAQGKRGFNTYVWAKDEAAALKIANERRVQAVLARETQSE